MMAIDGVALSGLVIALVALVISLFQLLQQLFATADGYRNCQSTVIGPWAKLTKRRPVFWQIRIRTIYKVPYIVVGYCDHEEIFCITGSDESRKRSYCPKLNQGKWPSKTLVGEMVSWIFFLDQLHYLASSYPETLRSIARRSSDPEPIGSELNIRSSNLAPLSYGPCVKLLRRSWDFMSPDIIKPLAGKKRGSAHQGKLLTDLAAVSNLGSIAILARRLGMTWTQFRPDDSVLRAEGNRMTITSTNIRSVGTILVFSRRQWQKPEMRHSDLYIPTIEADMMGFGIVPVWYSDASSVFAYLPEQAIRVGTHEDCMETMISLCGDCPATTHVRQELDQYRRMPGFSDIIPLAAPIMYSAGSTITRIPQPANHSLGLTVYRQAFTVFRHRLKEYIDKNTRNGNGLEQARAVLNWYDDLDSSSQWNDERLVSSTNNEDPDFLKKVREKCVAAQTYLQDLNDNQILHYEDLMHCHIERAVFYRKNAIDNISSGKARSTYGGDPTDDGRRKSEGMHMYFDYVENNNNPDLIFQSMKKRGYDGTHELLAQAWFTMIFRAFCWGRCHYMVRAQRVASEYWNSFLPVYLA